MIADKIINNWARALFLAITVPSKQGNVQLDNYREQTIFLQKLFTDDPRFWDYWNNCLISPRVKKASLRKIFSDNLSPIYLNFLNLLIDYRFFSGILVILPKILKMLNQSDNITTGIVYSVVPLTSQQLQQLVKKISISWKKKIILTNKLDPALIGGIKVVTDERVIDNSLAGKLHQMQQELLKLN